VAHYSLIWPVGLDEEAELPSADMETLDERVTACLHENGGTWNFTAQMVLGGTFGVHATAPFDLDDLDAVVPTSRKLSVTGTGAIEVASTAALTMLGTTNWPGVGTRNLDLWEAPRLLGLDFGGGAWNTSLYDSTNFQSSGDALALVGTASSRRFLLRFPRGPLGSTLVSVSILTEGSSDSGGALVVPKYTVRRRQIGTLASLSYDTTPDDISAEVDDVHTTANWESDRLLTTVPLTGTHTYAPETHHYYLFVKGPSKSGGAPGMTIRSVQARYSMQYLRPAG
jgi:hypothetical protein